MSPGASSGVRTHPCAVPPVRPQFCGEERRGVLPVQDRIVPAHGQAQVQGDAHHAVLDSGGNRTARTACSGCTSGHFGAAGHGVLCLCIPGRPGHPHQFVPTGKKVLPASVKRVPCAHHTSHHLASLTAVLLMALPGTYGSTIRLHTVAGAL